MSTSALITMLVALALVWGGFAAAVTVAVLHTRRQRGEGSPGE
jgi:hypothetical protein